LRLRPAAYDPDIHRGRSPHATAHPSARELPDYSADNQQFAAGNVRFAMAMPMCTAKAAHRKLLTVS